MGSSDSKDVKKFIKEVSGWQGWRVEVKPHGWVIYSPNKEHPPVNVKDSVHDWRMLKNLKSRLRRYGAPC